MTAVLQSYHDKLTERTANHMGYPYNLDFDYGALAGLERFSINNLGDPFIESNYGVHSREFEVRSVKNDVAYCHDCMCCVLAVLQGMLGVTVSADATPVRLVEVTHRC